MLESPWMSSSRGIVILKSMTFWITRGGMDGFDGDVNPHVGTCPDRSSNLRISTNGLVAQRIRAGVFETQGRGFESLRGYQVPPSSKG